MTGFDFLTPTIRIKVPEIALFPMSSEFKERKEQTLSTAIISVACGHLSSTVLTNSGEVYVCG